MFWYFATSCNGLTELMIVDQIDGQLVSSDMTLTQRPVMARL